MKYFDIQVMILSLFTFKLVKRWIAGPTGHLVSEILKKDEISNTFKTVKVLFWAYVYIIIGLLFHVVSVGKLMII